MSSPVMAVGRIESIAAGGAGVGRVDGMAVFVPRTAPGDLVEMRVTRRKRFGDGVVTRVLEPSADRVPPACGHYGGDACGGCQLQHLSGSAQRAAKRQLVEDALWRIARRRVDVDEVRPSPAQWRYRNKLTFALRRGASGWTMGLRRLGDPDAVFDTRECPITDEAVMLGWAEVRRGARFLPVEPGLRGSVRQAGGDVSFVLEGASRWAHAREFAEACPQLAAVTWEDAVGTVHAVVDRRAGDGPTRSFEQVNPAMAALMQDHVAGLVSAAAPASFIDAYSGAAALAARFLGTVDRVVAIELDPEAIRRARLALGGRGTVVAGRVEEHLAGRLPADVVVLNPPRSGVDAGVCRALERDPRPRRVIFVSCDPATLARDLSRLPSYRVVAATPFDMFPQTAHVEVVCMLEPVDA